MTIIKIGASKIEDALEDIIGFLEKGEIIICPTDTVYGFLVDAENNKAVRKIFEIKKRDESKPLGIFVKDIKTAKKFAFMNKNQESFLKDNKVTSILKAKKETLSKLVYKHGTIGIRIPNYEILNLILERFGKPVAQTSANISGKPATIKINDILKQFDKEDVIIIDNGDLAESEPSQVVDLTKNTINVLRK
jgi:L-threonylcarbamoyladenylate synthase